MRRNLVLAQVTNADDIPASGLPRKRDGFDYAFDWAVKFEPDTPDVLKIDPASLDLAAVAIARKVHRIKAVAPFEAWVACGFSGFDAPEEGLKGFIQAAQGRLTA